MEGLLVGAGNVGSVIASDLLMSGCRSLTVVDLDETRLKSLQRKHGDRVKAQCLDVTDERALARLMRDTDVTVNAASYKLNLGVLRAAIAAKSDYVDLGGLYHVTLQELRYERRARDAGVSMVLGMGDDPGTSNVMARLGSWELDSVSEIRVRWGSSSSDSQKVAFGFSVATCLDEATMNAVKFSGGKLVEVPPLSDGEQVEFPDPIGPLQTYAILHSELATLPRFIEGVRDVSYKDSWDRDTLSVVSFLRSSGFASDEPVVISGNEVSPRRVLLALLSPNEPKSAVGCLKVLVRGKRNGRREDVTYCLGPIRYSDVYHAPCTAYSTAIPASVVAQMLSRGLIEQKGVFPPEALNRSQVKYFLREMRARGLSVRRIRSAG